MFGSLLQKRLSCGEKARAEGALGGPGDRQGELNWRRGDNNTLKMSPSHGNKLKSNRQHSTQYTSRTDCIYSESSVIRTSIIRILDYPDHKITLHVTRGLCNYCTNTHTQYIQFVHFQSHTCFLCLKMAELLQSTCMYEHMHVYLHNVVFDCISLIRTKYL